MSHRAKKIIAVLLAIWLPLFSGSALAAAVSMQMPAGHCQDESMQMMDMADMDSGDMHTMSGDSDEHAPACNSCTVCHLACTAYLAVATLSMAALPATLSVLTPYRVVFHSFTSAPLLPPPLALV